MLAVPGCTAKSSISSFSMKPAPRTHTVAAGDTLFNIAKQYLGDGNRYQELAKFNNIANPDHIEVGQVINIP